MVSWLGAWFFQALPSEGVFSSRMEVKIHSLFSVIGGDKVLNVLGKKVQKSPFVRFLAFSFSGESRSEMCEVEQAY